MASLVRIKDADDFTMAEGDSFGATADEEEEVGHAVALMLARRAEMRRPW